MSHKIKPNCDTCHHAEFRHDHRDWIWQGRPCNSPGCNCSHYEAPAARKKVEIVDGVAYLPGGVRLVSKDHPSLGKTEERLAAEREIEAADDILMADIKVIHKTGGSFQSSSDRLLEHFRNVRPRDWPGCQFIDYYGIEIDQLKKDMGMTDDTMTTEEFNTLVEEQIKRSTDMLIKKAGEYATDTDRMWNFKQAGHLMGQEPEQALAGFLVKHIVSVFDMIRDVDKKDFTEEQWNEKITDSINYLLILRAMVDRRV